MFTGEPTDRLKLPQYQVRDHPDFLTDFNEAFQKIDKFVTEIEKELNALKEEVNRIKYEGSTK